MFEVDGIYANRKGKYKVLALDPPKMLVRFEDGTETSLNIGIQERIWENIRAELDLEESRRASRAARSARTDGTAFFIKSVSMVAQEEISAPTWREKVTMVTKPGPTIPLGSRIIYYDVETRTFFAVATVIGEATDKPPKGFFFPGKDLEDFTFYPIDMDTSIQNLEHAVSVESVELESLPDFKGQLAKPETYSSISEDDFEYLAELLTEVTEEEEEEDEDLDEEEEELEE